jgi:hypothetical protein
MSPLLCHLGTEEVNILYLVHIVAQKWGRQIQRGMLAATTAMMCGILLYYFSLTQAPVLAFTGKPYLLFQVTLSIKS